jgi:hypothetical protein
MLPCLCLPKAYSSSTLSYHNEAKHAVIPQHKRGISLPLPINNNRTENKLRVSRNNSICSSQESPTICLSSSFNAFSHGRACRSGRVNSTSGCQFLNMADKVAIINPSAKSHNLELELKTKSAYLIGRWNLCSVKTRSSFAWESLA